jgi:hypothetical protein
MTCATKWLAIAALLLSGCIAVAAQNAPASGQDKGHVSPPVADAGTTAQYNCISEQTKYTGSGKYMFYRIEITNKCEQRLKCAVFAYIVGSKGPAQGRTTLILAPKSSGAAATQVFDVKIKAPGGQGNWSRECRVN